MKCFFVLAVICVFSLLRAREVSADSSVTFIITGTARYTFSGYAAPNSVVTFLENDVSVGTTTPDSTGFFSKDIDDTDTLPHLISYYFTDKDGNISPTFTKTLQTNINNQITTSNILMPPTIYIGQTSITTLDTITISGYTLPEASVTVTINSAAITENTTSGPDGLWNIAVSASNIGSGDHTVSAVATQGTTTSETSTSLSFSITQAASNQTSTSNSSSTGNSNSTASKTTLSVNAPTSSPTKEVFFPGDFDHDGKVDEIDLGILLSHFNQLVTKATSLLDLDDSGKIGIKDFSILLYYWGR